jgi:hypothetical protein
MKCYYHPEVDAVGTCKNCSRGICPECLAELDNAIACKNRCEERVLAVERLVNRNITAMTKGARSYLVLALVYGILGIVFVGLGTFNLNRAANADVPPTFLEFLEIIGGLVFIGAAAYYYWLGTKLSSKSS